MIRALLGVLLYGAHALADTLAPYREMLINYELDAHPTPNDFSICHSHGCEEQSRVHLTAEQWQQVHQLFADQSADAEQERQAIARAVALLETMVGEIAGTSGDRGGNARGFGSAHYQQDCIDESANTTLYLTLLAEQQLLRWHTLEHRATRGYMIFGWPHSTAVIRDRNGGQLWTVDSWFHDNGQPPEIVPLEQWITGWKPEGFTGF